MECLKYLYVWGNDSQIPNEAQKCENGTHQLLLKAFIYGHMRLVKGYIVIWSEGQFGFQMKLVMFMI